jgi:hypothetical protein
MVCWLIYKSLVKDILKRYNLSDQDAIDILKDIEKETGHNHELIKAVIDFEGEKLIKRLKKKAKIPERAAATTGYV